MLTASPYAMFLHLDRSATPQERAELSASIISVAVFAAAENVSVVGNADIVNLDGSTPIASLLRDVANLLRREGHWKPMQTRYMEGSSSIARETRALDPSSAGGQSDRKRPALASRNSLSKLLWRKSFQVMKMYMVVQ